MSAPVEHSIDCRPRRGLVEFLRMLLLADNRRYEVMLVDGPGKEIRLAWAWDLYNAEAQALRFEAQPAELGWSSLLDKKVSHRFARARSRAALTRPTEAPE